jgi:tetratricopeptide (TPR) repeat protein
VLAVEEEPDSPIPLVQRAHILYYGRRYDEARADLRLALEYDSAFARAHLLDAVIDLVTDREQHALARLTGLRKLTGDTEPVVIALLGYAQARTGQRQAALEQLAWLEQARTRQWIPPELVALVHFALDDRANALTELERAYHEKSSGLVFIQVEPLMDALHGEPRFQDLLELMHGH